MNDDGIKKLFGQVPHFADQVIESFQPLSDDARQFVVSSYWSDRASVNLGDVCGTMHPDYSGMTWREFLANGRRMDSNLAAFGHNPDYYTDATRDRRPTMYFHRIDGKTFVMEDGNHRTCIGKFYFYGLDCPYIHRVHLIESVVDWAFLDLYRRLLVVCPASSQVTVTRETVRRDDGPGWKRDWFATTVRVADTKNNVSTARDYESLKEDLPAMEYAALKEFEAGFFSSEEEAAQKKDRPGFLRRFFK